MVSTRGRYPRCKPDPDLAARLKADAGGKCPVCLRKRPLVIHHDHASGEIVMACCDACNRGMGLLGDMISRLRRAADKIERPPARQLQKGEQPA
jgi:Recombination endonuclease VII